MTYLPTTGILPRVIFICIGHVMPKKITKRTNKTKLLAISSVIVLCVIFYCFIKVFFQSSLDYTTHKLALPDNALTDASESSESGNNDNKLIWTRLKPEPGDSLTSIFKKQGLSAKVLQNLLHDNPRNPAFSRINPRQELQFFIEDHQLKKLIIPVNERQLLVITYQNNHYISELTNRTVNTLTQYVTATVQGSLYITANRLHISAKLIKQMLDIFNAQINLAREARSGDRFSILYNALYIDNKEVDVGEVLAIRYTHQNKTYTAIKHTTLSGNEDYYTLEGQSLKKAFTRYPIRFSHISSTFNLARMHPILHYVRPHKGIDLAAPIGTPIYATGNGIITVLGRQGGYGNMIKIVHDRRYASVYGHLLKFQKGLSRGSHVTRGQLIGYVGQSGLADGPHCHYEFHVNHRPRNPATIPLPQALPISGKEVARFRVHAQTLLARLKLIEDAKLAANHAPTLTTKHQKT